MEINNFNLLSLNISFNSEDEFYFIQVLQRNKDNKEVNNSKNRLIKYYIIKSVEKFNEYQSEIISLCKVFNARAYIHPTKRSFKSVAKLHLKNVVDTYISEAYITNEKEYSTACGQSFVSEDKKYIIDVDNNDYMLEQCLYEVLNNSQPEGNKILYKVPTVNGYHLICSPFNTRKFYQDMVINGHYIDVHKNNPTLLYYYKYE